MLFSSRMIPGSIILGPSNRNDNKNKAKYFLLKFSDLVNK